MIEPSKVKAASEAAIRAVGGEVLDTLPLIGFDELNVRTSLAVAQRALVLSVMVNMSFGAPSDIARPWLAEHGLLEAVSAKELTLLAADASLDEGQKNRLRWKVESLWAAAWAGGLVDDLTPTQSIQDTLASLLPDLRSAEPPNDFLRRFRLRPAAELYEKLDLFYRAHWYARNCQLAGKDSAPFNLGVVQCRRQLLEWATHVEADWDDVDLCTQPIYRADVPKASSLCWRSGRQLGITEPQSVHHGKLVFR